MTKESPHTARVRAIYSSGPSGDRPNMIKPGTFGDGQPRMGTKPENVHRGERPEYGSPEGRKHREELRERPSAKPHRRFPNR
jgi:hypothetical protein